MESLWNKIIREAKTVSLTKEEHDFMIENIRKQVYHKASPVHTNTKKQIKSPYLYHFRISLSLHEKRFVPVAVFIILVIFGGTSFAANFALPGEALYGMKVNVNEQMESWIALSPNANARFEVVKAGRRLKEVEKLTVQKKKITPKAKAQIKENFTKNAEKVKQIVAEIEASGESDAAAEVKAEFENNLEAHSVVLSKLASDEDTIVEIDDEGKSDIKEIGAMVDEHISGLKADEESKAIPEDKTKSKDGSKKDADANKSESKDAVDELKNEQKEGETSTDPALLLSTETELKLDDGDSAEIKTKTEADIEEEKEESRIKEDKVKVEVNNILTELKLQVED